jgi:hypothetical protein
MAERKRTAKVETPEREYHIVNPAGAIHSVTREHARTRLATVGWRMATPDEVAAYKGQTIQRYDDPICAPWSPDPDAQLDLPE